MALVAGLALFAAHPGLGIWPLTFVGVALFVGAVWHDDAVRQQHPLPAWLVGAITGAAFFGPLLLWLILPAGMIGWGLLTGIQILVFMLLAVLIRRVQYMRFSAVAVATLWTATDVIRGMFPLGGFQWGAIAYAHTDASWLLPVARILGAHGITFFVVVIAVALVEIVGDTVVVARNRKTSGMGTNLSLRHVPTVTLLAGLFASVLLTVEPPGTVGVRDVLAVQGNDVKHWMEPRAGGDVPLRIVNEHARLTREAVIRDGVPDLTLWAESAIDRDPFSARGANLQPAITAAAADAGSLIAGITLDGEDPVRERYVAAALFDEDGQLADQYTKRQLVPFGEYIPARRFLDWIPALAQIPRDAQPGTQPQQIILADGTTVAVVICFEAMFSPVVRSNIRAGSRDAELLVVLTNNASFGLSAAPYQHLAQSRLRAVETGRWVVHVAISGASAIIDPYGVVHHQTDLFTLDTIRSEVPLVAGRTPFLATGDVFGASSVAGLFGLIAMLAIRRVRPVTSHKPE